MARGWGVPGHGRPECSGPGSALKARPWSEDLGRSEVSASMAKRQECRACFTPGVQGTNARKPGCVFGAAPARGCLPPGRCCGPGPWLRFARSSLEIRAGSVYLLSLSSPPLPVRGRPPRPTARPEGRSGRSRPGMRLRQCMFPGQGRGRVLGQPGEDRALRRLRALAGVWSHAGSGFGYTRKVGASRYPGKTSDRSCRRREDRDKTRERTRLGLEGSALNNDPEPKRVGGRELRPGTGYPARPGPWTRALNKVAGPPAQVTALAPSLGVKRLSVQGRGWSSGRSGSVPAGGQRPVVMPGHSLRWPPRGYPPSAFRPVAPLARPRGAPELRPQPRAKTKTSTPGAGKLGGAAGSSGRAGKRKMAV